MTELEEISREAEESTENVDNVLSLKCLFLEYQRNAG